MQMNIEVFIKSHPALAELPFMVVFRTISLLNEMGMLKHGMGAE
jgi:hypothetical protein